MKKGILSLVLTAAITLVGSARAHEMAAHAPMGKVVGEVVDTGCFLGHAAKGTSHTGCATKCINAGMPMGILTSSGVLYLVTMNHDNPDAYKRLKTMAGKSVAATGHLYSRAGMKAIDVTSFAPAS